MQMVSVYRDPDGEYLFKGSLPAQSNEATKQQQIFRSHQEKVSNGGGGGGGGGGGCGDLESKGSSTTEAKVAVSLKTYALEVVATAL